MRVAYADPPYPGQKNRYEHRKEVNHRLLIAHLQEYDGWALSTSSTSLRTLLPLCPEKTRVAAWCKPFASWKSNQRPVYAWEPLLFRPARRCRSFRTFDWLKCGTMQFPGGGFTGAKPPEFCGWIFEMLGMEPEDDLYDLFPGTGAVSDAWLTWRRTIEAQGPLFLEAAT